MLSVRGLHVAYGRAPVLHGIDLEIPAGGFLCLLGRNGVGKTTLLNTVMGVLAPSRGEVRFDGRDVTSAAPYARVRAGMAYVPQGRDGFPHLTVAENLGVVAEASARGDRSAIDEVLDLFPRLVPLLGRRGGNLSGGQKQQLAMARALVTRPQLLVLDEPTEGIQPSIIAEVEDAVLGLRQRGDLAFLLVEQYVEFALRLADTYAVMDVGRIVDTGPAASLHADDASRLLAV
ncbi:MAG: urea ABC transporter ATP-binding subunit UrtE [Actinobacteria bacterium]|nr:urea ABC transporter ATP-binding subunit UrtE [Actinomycetota bacterium]